MVKEYKNTRVMACLAGWLAGCVVLCLTWHFENVPDYVSQTGGAGIRCWSLRTGSEQGERLKGRYFCCLSIIAAVHPGNKPPSP
ncbi:hypothetical protein B0O80DRAFT_465974 [Mortierella sp. GBAus27b]|nr:hypothetical protein B0O80DRAFT_465974 [Mortierella sp. GBAus27b]